MTRKVRYIAGKSCELAKPLSDGRSAFNRDIVYTIENHTDFLRLIGSGDFVEVIVKKENKQIGN